MKILLRLLGVVVLIGVAGYAASWVSPWPGAIAIRIPFDIDAWRMNAALAERVPAGVSAELNIPYAADEANARLDIYYPSTLDGTEQTLPTVVWVHGGGFVSGSKDLVANYLKILAGNGYTVVGVGYAIAPGAIYPAPIRQVNAALAFLKANGHRLHVDASRLVLAGDSAGAQIAAQLANIVTVPSYADAVGIAPAIEPHRLQGVVLFCGVYDIANVDPAGLAGWFTRTVLWAYSGTTDFTADAAFANASVAEYVTGAFPASFISAGNADPLLPQSQKFATVLTENGVPVDTLFFPVGYQPPVPHVYQFNLDTEAGRQALDRSVAFLNERMPRD